MSERERARGTEDPLAPRFATAIVTTVVLAAASTAAFALAYDPVQEPRPADLPRVVVARPTALATAPVAPASPATPAAAPRRPAAPAAPASAGPGPARSSHEREVVTAPLHDSEGEGIPNGDAEHRR